MEYAGTWINDKNNCKSVDRACPELARRDCLIQRAPFAFNRLAPSNPP